jgi:hypothetical protein
MIIKERCFECTEEEKNKGNCMPTCPKLWLVVKKNDVKKEEKKK